MSFENTNNVPDINSALIEIRLSIGNLPDDRLVTEDEVEDAVSKLFPQLSEADKNRFVSAFLETERSAVAEADALAERRAA